MAPNNGYAAYANNKIMTASPAELTLMLYEGAIKFCNNRDDDFSANKVKFTKDDINNLERILLSCSNMINADSEINIILIEEMPAYFLGQKNLDAVIKIAQDRAQKVLDERG